jgi:hypothetical protein
MSKHQQSKMLSISEELEQRCLAGLIPYSVLTELAIAANFPANTVSLPWTNGQSLVLRS